MSSKNDPLRSSYEPISSEGRPSGLAPVVALANKFIVSALADSTKQAYDSGVRSYIKFCEVHNMPFTMPISDENACLWASYVATRIAKPGTRDRGALQFKTIKLYAQGIRNYHIEWGFEDWLGSLRLFHRCMKGIKRTLGEKDKKTRLPITTALLDSMKTKLTGNNYSHTMFWAAATLGTYGLLRMGEFCIKKDDEVDDPRMLLLNQITLFNSRNERVTFDQLDQNPEITYYAVRLRTSKTDPYRKGVTIYVSHKTPVTAMVAYLKCHPSIQDSMAPLFTMYSIPGNVTEGSKLIHVALDAITMMSMTRSILDQLNIDSRLYFGHSFRRGGATSLAANGVADGMIQILGRWVSDCYKLYIDIPLDKILSANRSM